MSSLPIAIATVRKEEPLEVRQAVAERIKAELTAYGFKFRGCDL